MALTDFMRRF